MSLHFCKVKTISSIKLFSRWTYFATLRVDLERFSRNFFINEPILQGSENGDKEKHLTNNEKCYSHV